MKRLVKSPKVFIRDSGLLHALLDIETMDDLYAHPVFGASWEGFIIEQLLAHAPKWKPSYYRTRNGAEIDLILEYGDRRIAVEAKTSSSPKLEKGNINAMEDVKADELWLVAPVDASYPLNNATVYPITEALKKISD